MVVGQRRRRMFGGWLGYPSSGWARVPTSPCQTTRSTSMTSFVSAPAGSASATNSRMRRTTDRGRPPPTRRPGCCGGAGDHELVSLEHLVCLGCGAGRHADVARGLPHGRQSFASPELTRDDETAELAVDVEPHKRCEEQIQPSLTDGWRPTLF